MARTVTSTAAQDKTPTVQINLGEDFSGQIIVGDNDRQAFYSYTCNIEHGGILNVAAPPQINPRPTPVNRRPPPVHPGLDRSALIPTLVQALQEDRAIELYGAEGVGKTALLRYLVYDIQAIQPFSDGVVYLSGYPQLAKDLLQVLYDAFYESRAPYKPSYPQAQQALHDKQTLIILDHLSLEKVDLDWLMAAVPQAGFVVVSTDRRYGLKAVAVPPAGLPLDDSMHLIQQALGRSLTPTEQMAARVLWTTLAGHPLQLRRAAAQVKEQKQSLVELATSATSKVSLFQKIVEVLSRSHRQLLTLLGAMGGVALTLEQVLAISQAQTGEFSSIPKAEALLCELQRLHLVETVRLNIAPGVTETGYQLYPDLVDLCQQIESSAPWISSAVEYFTHQVIPQKLPQSTDTLQYLADWSAQTEHWHSCLELDRALEGLLSLQGRWGQWQQVLEQSLQAAQHIGDQAAEAWSLHQLGTRALGEGEITVAETILTQALHLRQALGDQVGAAVTRHNLGLLIPPVVAPTPVEVAPTRSHFKTALMAALMAALTGVGALSLLAGVAAMRWLSHPVKSATLDLSNEILVFGERELKTSSAPQTLILSNLGERPLIIDNVELTGDRDFAIHDENCTPATSLDPADSCKIAIIFQPRAQGDRTATLQLSASGTEYDIALTGSGTAQAVPGVSFEPSSLNFKELYVGNAKATRVTLTNDGTAPLTLKTLAIIGGQAADFAIAQSGCAEATLAPEASCTLELQFKPGGPGERYASLTVKSNADADAMLSLSGIGTQQPVPIAADDSATTQVNQPVTIDVLTNDRDPAGGTLTLTSVAPAKAGQVRINDDNTLTYSPGAEATQERFSYTVSNTRGEIAKAMVSVTVEAAPAPNRPPRATPDQAQTDTGKSVTLQVLANDSDPDEGDQIAIAAVEAQTQSGGRVDHHGDGTLTYSPPPAFVGIDRFTYTLRDRSGATTTATVEVTVNGPLDEPVDEPIPPIAKDDSSQTLPGQTVTIQILANDEGSDVAIASLDRNGRLGGRVSNNRDGTVNYTPPPDFLGVDTFTYTIRERVGTLSELATVSVVVKAFNRPPIAQNDSNDYGYAAQPRPVRLNVLANDSDPDSGSADLTIASVTQGQYTQVEISADRRAVIYTMTLPPLQEGPNGFPDSFTYTIRDADGAVSEPATVNLFGYYPSASTPDSPPSP